MALGFYPRYVMSIPWGVMKLAQVLLCLVVLICVATIDHGADEGAKGFIWFVAVGAVVTTLVFILLYVLHIPDTVERIPWMLIELIHAGFWFVFYVIAFVVACVMSSAWARWTSNVHAAAGAAAFFCLLAAIVFGLNAFLAFRHRNSNIRSTRETRTTQQGGVTVTSTHTTYEETSRKF